MFEDSTKRAKTDNEILYIEASKAYNDGEDIMTDDEFNLLEEKLRREGSVVVNYTHDQFAEGDLDEETLSILPVYNWEDVYAWMQSTGEEEYLLSQKVDGVNAKAFFSLNTGRWQARSRARDGRSAFDYTEALSHILPRQNENVGAVGEVFLPKEHLPYFREKYDKPDKFKLPRSGAIMLLRRPQDYTVEDLKLLQFRAFSTTLPSTTKQEEFEILKQRGFNIPDYLPTLKSNVTENYNQLEAATIPLDGIVLEVNRKSFIPEVKGKYQSSQIAVKIGSYGDEKHEAVVTDIHIEPARGNFGVVLQIEPYLMPDGATITRVNAFNIGIVMRKGIQKGSKIKFLRKANGMTVLVYGEEKPK